MARKKKTAVEQILEILHRRPKRGATKDELERITKLPHQTVSARLSEMEQGGIAHRTTQVRKTRWGRGAAAYVAA